MSILVERDNIGIFGKMNSGKSSLMNLLTQQETSIVDSKPGTTADTKTALLEFHGLGPVRIFDTAGADETGVLGGKKRKKVFTLLKECDLAIVVFDPSVENIDSEKEIIEAAREEDKQILVVYNLFTPQDAGRIPRIEQAIPTMRFLKTITLRAVDTSCRPPLIEFVLANFESKNQEVELLPFLERDQYYILIIPMDIETPPGRYLRPQAMTEEYITRNWAYPVSFRLDLQTARSDRPDPEKQRFMDFLANFKKRPKAIITDSQAMDIMHRWCPDNIMLTTFSITMINYFSRGRLPEFAKGIRMLNQLKPGDRVLIVEACNHSRVGEDIGTVQIPAFFQKTHPQVILDHNFGREFQENQRLSEYKLIIHCGGCMISQQKILARIKDLEVVGVPFTNYGVFLSFIQGERALQKVLQPWEILDAREATDSQFKH